MSHSLATSSLLKAVGVTSDAAGAAGATAAVKWITKDGIGAFGRLLVPTAWRTLPCEHAVLKGKPCPSPVPNLLPTLAPRSPAPCTAGGRPPGPGI